MSSGDYKHDGGGFIAAADSSTGFIFIPSGKINFISGRVWIGPDAAWGDSMKFEVLNPTDNVVATYVPNFSVPPGGCPNWYVLDPPSMSYVPSGFKFRATYNNAQVGQTVEVIMHYEFYLLA